MNSGCGYVSACRYSGNMFKSTGKKYIDEKIISIQSPGFRSSISNSSFLHVISILQVIRQLFTFFDPELKCEAVNSFKAIATAMWPCITALLCHLVQSYLTQMLLRLMNFVTN